MKRVALVTGCSTGFGEAIARGLLADGHTVVATMRDVGKAGEALRQSGADLVALDVVDPASRARAVQDVVARHGRIDVLVNNAGIAARASVEDGPEELLRKVMETNFFGPVALTRLVLPVMRAQRSGRIVNVTAIGALLCSPFLSAYCASKHAMDAVTAALDVEARALGIRVCSVLPGQFRTAIGANMVSVAVGDDYAPVSAHLARQFQARADDADTSLQPVVDAVLAGVRDEDPQQRYVVGKGGALLLPPVVAALQDIHRIETERARLS